MKYEIRVFIKCKFIYNMFFNDVQCYLRALIDIQDYYIKSDYIVIYDSSKLNETDLIVFKKTDN